MDLNRRNALAAGGVTAASLLLPVMTASGADAAPSPYARFIGPDRKSITLLRVVAAGGNSSIQEESLAVEKPFGPNNLGQWLDRKATAYAVYSCPANYQVPGRVVLAGQPELLYFTEGGATVRTKTDTREVTSGTLILFEDAKGSGHTIDAGPKGYTVLKLLLAG